MKKTALLCILIIGFFELSAQPNLGLYVGLNNAGLVGDVPDNAKYQGQAGFTLGINADFKIAKDVLLSFQPGYTQSNVAVTFIKDASNVYKDSVDLQFSQVSLPLMLNVISNNEKWYFTSGLTFGYMLDTKATSNGVEEDISEEVNAVDLSINFGLTYIIPIGEPFLFVSARYAQGLVNLTNGPEDASLIPRIKSTGIQLLAGIQIPLKSE